jgi:hypothetical protein
MNSRKTARALNLKLLGAIVATNRYFWVSLIGFITSILGTLPTHGALYGFGCGLFGVVLACCLFTSWIDYQRATSCGIRKGQHPQRNVE